MRVEIKMKNLVTKSEIKKRLALYEKDLVDCKNDLRHDYINGNPPGMPNAIVINNKECRRRIAYYAPAIRELKWVLGLIR
jgi:hypothetical protein